MLVAAADALHRTVVALDRDGAATFPTNFMLAIFAALPISRPVVIAVMARDPKQSDCDVAADGPSINDNGRLARLMGQSEILELFDAVARRRFGQIISAARLKPAKRHRRDRAA
jgi:hypothetical protein